MNMSEDTIKLVGYAMWGILLLGWIAMKYFQISKIMNKEYVSNRSDISTRSYVLGMGGHVILITSYQFAMEGINKWLFSGFSVLSIAVACFTLFTLYKKTSAISNNSNTILEFFST